MQSEQEMLERWKDSAPFWETHREIIRHMFEPVTDALLEEAPVSAGQCVLDVATGPGEPSLTIAPLVGPQGKVFGVDAIPEMIAAARREADRRGLKNVQFEVALADRLPFSDNMFDAVISRFGVMLFPSPVDAVHEMLRVLKPGRKLALAVWHFAARNPFHCSLSRVVDRYVDSPPPEPDKPDVFRFAARDKLLELVKQADVKDASERLLQFTIEVPMSPENLWEMRLGMSEKLREKVRSLSAEQMAQLKSEALDSIREYSADGGARFPAEVLIVSGAKESA